LSPLDLSITVGYVIGVLALGWFVSHSITGFSDYFVAGGRMTAPLLVCTLVSTYYGLDVLAASATGGSCRCPTWRAQPMGERRDP